MAEEQAIKDENIENPETNNELTSITEVNTTIEETDQIPLIQEEFVKKNDKSSLLKKILFGVIGFLVLFLVIGLVLFFLGFFDAEEKPQAEVNPKEVAVQKQEEKPVYNFDIKDINSKKLNEELAFLTNKNLNQEKNEEIEKNENEKKLLDEAKKKEEDLVKTQEDEVKKSKEALEAKKLQLEKEKAELEALKEEALSLKNDLIQEKDKIKETEISVEKKVDLEKSNLEKVSKEELEEKDTEVKTEKTTDNTFLKFINVAKIKGSLYKSYLDKVTKINSNVILCRDDKNRIELFFGPFNDDAQRSDLLNKLIKNGFDEAYELEFTKEEFDKKCNY